MIRPCLLLAALNSLALAQTTQGLITGRVRDAISGRPIGSAEIAYRITALNLAGSARSSSSGHYVLPMLSPGVYRLRISAPGYRAQELYELSLPVAGKLELSFLLRPLADVWDSGRHHSIFLPHGETIVRFFGPDVDPSRSGTFEPTRGRRGPFESTVSAVIDPSEVRDLPLAGRDVYTMLVALPGVAADVAAGRGLGLSVNGQRPSASNFLLDGIENNDYLVTGPATSVAPEVVQEYAVSTSSFSAEYGRAAGFLANAVTRTGGSRWHGEGYWNLKNDVLNANGFRENMQGLPRPPMKQNQSGFEIGGPLVSKSLFVSSAFDYLRNRSFAESERVMAPSTEFLTYTAPNSIARRLLTRFPAPPATNRSMPAAEIRLSPPVSINRRLFLERADWMPAAGRFRLMGRFALSRVSRPEFIWSPYSDFVSGLDHDNSSLAVGMFVTLRPDLTNELRSGFTHDDLGWDRAHPEIPTLASFDGTVLPGSPAFYAFSNRGRALELVDNLLWATDRHTVKLGGGFLLRRLEGALTAGRDGRYLFFDILDFYIDRPLFFSAALSRRRLPSYELPAYDRTYRYNQFHLFAQDTFRATPRLTLNFGLRYENFGAPANTGRLKDGVVDRGRGQVAFQAGGDQRLFEADNRGWAPRFGFSWDPRGRGRTLLRGAYGLFYDRPFDNLWLNQRNNEFILPNFLVEGGDYLTPVSSVLAGYERQPFASDFPAVLEIDRRLRNGYVQSYFAGIQHQGSESWSMEANYLGSLGRRLITTDQQNRPGAGHISSLPGVVYRSSQGLSDYHALAVLTRYRSSRAMVHVSYTWSHAIDLQSEPLASDYFDLSFARLGNTTPDRMIAAFTSQGDSRGDRGHSDFDHRHNLVFMSIWELPRVLRGWRASQIASFRTGRPFTVVAPSTAAYFNNRADVVGPTGASREVDGGRQVLNPAGFSAPPANRTGNSSRNAFHGPGYYTIDVSLSRAFPIRRIGESFRLVLRADAFNLFNHANLGEPDAFLDSPTFGVARFGRRGRQTGFPALIPFEEAARQVQILLRLEF